MNVGWKVGADEEGRVGMGVGEVVIVGVADGINEDGELDCNEGLKVGTTVGEPAVCVALIRAITMYPFNPLDPHPDGL